MVAVVNAGVQLIHCSQPRGSLSEMCLRETSAKVEIGRSNGILKTLFAGFVQKCLDLRQNGSAARWSRALNWA